MKISTSTRIKWLNVAWKPSVHPWIYLSFLLAIALPASMDAQCPLQPADSAIGTVGTDTLPVIFTNCANVGENAVLNGIDSGQTYVVDFTGSGTSVYITVYNETDSLVTNAFGDSVVTFTAQSSGTYRISITDTGGSCTAIDSACRTLTVTCTSCLPFVCMVPQNPFIDTITLTSASLRWDSVPGALQYNVIGNAVGQIKGQFSINVADNSFEFINLNPGIQYWWSVRSICDSAGTDTSAYTPNDTFTTPAPFMCVTPTGRFTDSITATSARINWNSVDGAVTYNIIGNAVGSTTGQFNIFVSDTNYIIAGLTPGVSYFWSIRTLCDSMGLDASAFSGNLTFNTLGCMPPDSLMTSNVTFNSATLTWKSVQGVVTYRVIGNVVGDSIAFIDVLTPDTFFQFTGLSEDTAYWWSVKAICDSSGFPSSDFAENDTFQTPAFICVTPMNLITDSITSSGALVGWDPVPGAIGYNVIGNIVGDSTILINGTTAATSFQLSSLAPDDLYWWSVRAICDNMGDVSPYAPNDTFATLPLPPCDSPLNLSVDTITMTSAALTWSSVSGAIGYTVIGNAVGALTGQFSIDVTDTTYTLSGLNPGVAYWWSVRTVCNLQFGSFSAYAANDTFTTIPPPTCPVPQNLLVDTVTTNAAVLKWDSADGALGYRINIRFAGDPTVLVNTTTTNTSFVVSGLIPDTSYMWTVRTICDLMGDVSAYATDDTFATLAPFACAVPQNPTVDTVTTTSALFTWDSVPGAIGYRIIGNSVDAGSGGFNVVQTGTAYVLTNLNPGESYWWAVRAICDLMGNASAYTANDTFMTTALFVCQVPQNLMLDTANSNSAVVSWDSVPGAIGYRINGGIVGDSNVTIDQVTANTMYAFLNLMADTSYWWSVRAICDLMGDASDFSQNDTFSTTPPPVCQVPQNPTTDTITPFSATLTWNPVSSAIGYRIIGNAVGAMSGQFNITQTDTFLVLSGLNPEVAYWWSVRAICDLMGNASAFTQNDTFITPPVFVCEVPQNLMLDTASTTEAIVKWDSVAGAIGYRINAGIVGDLNVTIDVVTANTMYAFLNLMADTSYWWTVRAICDLMGDASAFAPNDTFSTLPPLVCQVPENRIASDITAVSAVLSWDSVPGAIGYRVIGNVVGDSTISIDQVTTANMFTLTGLSLDTSYYWSVRAICDLMGNSSAFSPNDTFTTLGCEVPENLVATNIMATSAVLNWDAVPGAIGYRIVGNAVGDSTFLVDVLTAQTSFTLANLMEQTAYWWTVRTICDQMGDASAFAENDTFITAPSFICAVPGGLISSGITDTSVQLMWDSVPGALQYNALLLEVDSATALIDSSVSATTLFISGLSPGTVYRWTVRALCDTAGTLVSAFADADTFLTDTPALCNEPMNLMTGSITDSSAILLWNAVSDAENYNITGNELDSTGNLFDLMTTDTSIQVNGLTAGTTYYWSVRSICDTSGILASAFSITDTFTTFIDILGCTDSNALNFNPLATIDDGSCIYPPSNDLCGDAIDVNCGDSLSGTTTGASIDTTVGTCGTILETAGGVWYAVTGDGSVITASLCGSAFDTKLGIFAGSCDSLVCIDGNDDACSTQSEVSFATDSGSTYYIYVTGFGNESGDFNLALSCAIPGCTDPMALNFDSLASIDDSSCIYPIAGGKDVQYTSARMILDGDTVDLTGSTIVRRGDAFLNNDNMLEIPLEMESMCLEGQHPVLGAIEVKTGSKFGKDTIAGAITQMPGNPPSMFALNLSMNLNLDIEGYARACVDTAISMSGIIGEIPICQGTLVADTPIGQLTECCSTDSLTSDLSFFSISMDCNQAIPISTASLKTSQVTIVDSSFNSGTVRLDLVTDANCDSVVLTSGDVNVGNEQKAQETAEAVALALAAQAALNPACGILISTVGNTITITSDLPYEVSCCLKGTDQQNGVILEDTTVINLGQRYQKSSTVVAGTDFTCSCEPSNDLCENAIHLECGDVITGSTTDATDSDNPPSCDTTTTGAGVWYSIDGTGDSISISLCGSSYDTYIGIYEIITVDSLNCIAFNDDLCGDQSEVTWLSQAGASYKVFVTGNGTSKGEFTLAATCVGVDCAKPALIWVDNISNSTVTLHWTEVPGVAGYRIEGNALGGAPIVIDLTGSTTTQFEVKNLPAGLFFEWRVTSLCNSSATMLSQATPYDTFQTLAVCPRPGPISSTVNSSTSVTLHWTPVNSAIAYRIAGGVVGGTIVQLTIPGTGTSSFTVNNLTPGLTYGWTVRALCFKNQSLNVQPVNFFTLPGVSEKSGYGESTPLWMTPDASVKLALYPNPTTGLLTIELAGDEAVEDARVEVFDLSGQLMEIRMEDASSSSKLVLDLSHLAGGMYSILVHTENGVYANKVVVNNQ